MDNFKTFMNIAFVILCLVMLWYLFTWDTGANRTIKANDRGNSYASNEYETQRDSRSDSYIREDRNLERTKDLEIQREIDKRKELEREIEREMARDNYAREAEPDYPVREYSRIEEPEQKKKGGFLDRWFNTSDEEETAPRRYEGGDERYPDRYESRDYNEYKSEDPYVKDRKYEEPVATDRRPVETNRNEEQTDQRRYTGEILYRPKRFSRDGKLGTYKGPMKDDEPHGFAVFEYDNGDIYIGEYRYGTRNGYGNSIFKNKSKVQLRKYLNGDKILQKNIGGVSFGSMTFVHGGEKGLYKGPMRNGQPHGFGYFKYNNGNMYVGSYQEGKRNGTGNLIYSNGKVVFLEYKNGIELKNSKYYN